MLEMNFNLSQITAAPSLDPLPCNTSWIPVLLLSLLPMCWQEGSIKKGQPLAWGLGGQGLQRSSPGRCLPWGCGLSSQPWGSCVSPGVLRIQKKAELCCQTCLQLTGFVLVGQGRFCRWLGAGDQTAVTVKVGHLSWAYSDGGALLHRSGN